MDSTAAESPMRKQAEEGAGMDPTGGDSPMRKQAKEGAQKGAGSSMPIMTFENPFTGVRFEGTPAEAFARFYESMRQSAADMKAASGLELGGKQTRRNMQIAEGGKAAASACRPVESLAATGRPEEALSEAAKTDAEGGKAAASAWGPEESVEETAKSFDKETLQPQDYSTQREAQSEQKQARKEGKPKKHDSKQRKEKTKKSLEDSIGSHEIGDRFYEGVTLKEATRFHKKHLERLAKKNKKNQKKVKDEDAGKAVASVTPEESVTDSGRPEAWKAGEAVTAGSSKSAMNEEVFSPENELAKRFEMTRFTPEMHLYDEILRALFHFQKSKNMKIDKETLQLLKDMASKLAKKNEEDLDHDSGKSATPGAKKTPEEEMADEAERFASHRRLWKYEHRKTCGSFTDITLLSSMQFTHYMPGRGSYSSDCTTPETLQIVSIELTGLAGGLELPLSVYGVVAVRDMVDHNRNILFYLHRYQAQELKQNDPFLHLTGPSRAIVLKDKVCIEIELKVKGFPKDEDLISCARCYYTGEDSPGMSTICFKNALCTLELCLEPVKKTAQATILGVHVKGGGSWPFQYGGLVGCSPRPGKFVLSDSRLTRKISPSSSKIVLIQSKDEAMPKGENGHVLLWRQVVSVNLEGRLDVVIKAYSKDGDIAAETSVSFYPKVCNISVKKCLLGDAEVVTTVAWSLVAMSKLSGNSAGSGGSFIQEEAENELEKRFEMTRITPERHLYDEIQTALFDFQYELTTKNRKIDKETLQLLKDMSSKLAKKDEEDLDHDSGKSATPGANKTPEEEMADEAERFASYRRFWEYKHRGTCGSFTNTTLLSSMQFTHYTPGREPYSIGTTNPETLQIVSMKLSGLAGGLQLPLSVYGVVAVRDMVDRNRNILFYLNRSKAQELKQDDPFLHLTGPSRAILFTDKVWIEVELKVKDSQDKDLISCARSYYTREDGPGVSTICFKSALCTLELCLEPVQKTVQATILGVHVVKGGGSWPSQYGGLIACSPQLGPRISPSSSQIVLIESKDGAIPKAEDGHVLLQRQVVSVNLQGRLDVVIKAYSKSGDIAAETSVPFHPKVCNVSKKKCLVGDAEVAIRVAWSLVATELWLELTG